MIGKRDNMNKKGQALVEFILILPVLLLIVMALIDVGNIFLKKYELNNDLETVTELYKNNNEKELSLYLSSEDLTLDNYKDGVNKQLQFIPTADHKILQKANVDAKEFLKKESLDDYIHIKNELSKSLNITHV